MKSHKSRKTGKAKNVKCTPPLYAQTKTGRPKLPALIETKAELARQLDLTRPTLNKYLAIPGAPKKGPKGWALADVVGFIGDNAELEATAVKALPDLRAARVKELHLRCERLKFDLDKDRRKYALKSEIRAAMTRALSQIPALAEQRICNEMPMAVSGLDVPQARIYGKRLYDELMLLFQRAGEALPHWGD